VLQRDLERSIVGINFPVCILWRCRFEKLRRRRIAGQPQLRRIIINCIGTAENFGARISCISPDSNIFELEHTAALIVAE